MLKESSVEPIEYTTDRFFALSMDKNNDQDYVIKFKKKLFRANSQNSTVLVGLFKKDCGNIY